ncbi:MAG: divalent-cation tolerance protein CutA [Candidatus Omnitrophica bacterium]|nr:divalent-cation tolerance protein CutA [Candidatus Omnitrophota bacterium]
MAKNCVIIMVTCASREEARRIAGRLLEKRLVACANILPKIESRFWWKGKLDSAAELLVTMKTVRSNFKKIEAEIKRVHSYEVPEIIAVPIVSGSRDYLDWISRTVI